MVSIKSLAIDFLVLTVFIIFSSCQHNISSSPSTDVNITGDIVYGKNTDWKGNEQSLKLDLYSPKNLSHQKRYPLIVFIHGGGFVAGDKKTTANECSILADSGFIVASVNYRLGWDKGSNACDGNVPELFDAGYRSVQDINASLRFLVSKANEYFIDTSWIFLAGSSAGAIIALHSVYLNDTNGVSFFHDAIERFGTLHSADNDLKNIYSIKGICSISGALVDSNFINTSNAIPAIFFHGAKDQTIPSDKGTYMNCNNYPAIYGSLCLYRRMTSLGVTAVAHILPNAGHGKEGESEYSDEFKMSKTADFFHDLMGKNFHANRLYTGKQNSYND
jgi:dipeptidyl aminopeptidase/acylaminoacyl peptidase